MRHIFVLFVGMLIVANASAQSSCGVLFGQAPYVAPASVDALEDIFSHQTREFKQKAQPYEVFAFDVSKIFDPKFTKFQEESVEIIINGLGKNLFRHVVLRVGTKIYSFNMVRSSLNGVPFRSPDATTDAKGVAFVVGKEKIASIQNLLNAVYSGMSLFNNPPFSSTGGRLDIIKQPDGSMKFSSKESLWIPGKGKADMDVYKNNQPFVGQIVEVADADGKIKNYLQSQLGVKTPISVDQKTGQFYVNGLSCASSAELILKIGFGIETFSTPSAPNLVKHLVEGNVDFAATPDAVIFYGPERKAPVQPLLAAGERPASPAVVEPVVALPEPVVAAQDEVTALPAEVLAEAPPTEAAPFVVPQMPEPDEVSSMIREPSPKPVQVVTPARSEPTQPAPKQNVLRRFVNWVKGLGNF